MGRVSPQPPLWESAPAGTLGGVPPDEPTFVVAQNPDPDSTLPYLLRLPIDGGIELKAKERWPATARVYCHPVDEWPADAPVLEEGGARHRAGGGRASDHTP